MFLVDAFSFWVITQAYFYVILDGNYNCSFNTEQKINYSMERIVIKIKLKTAKIICSDSFSSMQTKRPPPPPTKQNFALFLHSGTPKVMTFFCFRNHFVSEHLKVAPLKRYVFLEILLF